MNRKMFFLFALLFAVTLYLVPLLPRQIPAVRGKFSGQQPPSNLSSADIVAINVAVENATVKSYLGNHKFEVLSVLKTGESYRSKNQLCSKSTCSQVNIYDFDAGANVVVIMNDQTKAIADIFYQPYNRPLLNSSLLDLAQEIALNSPEVWEALGFKPENVSMAPNDSGVINTICDQGHVCVATTFEQSERNLWAIIDLTEQKLVDVRWTALRPNIPGNQPRSSNKENCTLPGQLSKNGWSVNYEMTNTDGLNVYNVTFNDLPVFTSAKLVEWHVNYNGLGYIDSIGCKANAGYPIEPYGETTVVDLNDAQGNVIGFSVNQDFRMPNWGDNCNYRYELHFQFFNDGSFRTVTSAFGRGCGATFGYEPIYRPVIRIDMAVNGDDGDRFEVWDGSTWKIQPIESWWQQSTSQIDEWRIMDQNGTGYSIEPNWGQFGDATKSDEAFLYVTYHYPGEGDVDLGSFDSTSYCCQNSYLQGPNDFLDGDIIENKNIVLWYVPKMEASSEPGTEYCWTLQGDPTPITMECYAGPMFRPIIPPPTAVTTTQTKSPPPNQWVVLGSVGLAVLILSGYAIGRSAINRKSEEQP